MYQEICCMYQKTHSKCTRALHTAQRDLVRKKKNGFSTPPILRFSRRPRLLAAIAAPLDRRRPRFRCERTLWPVGFAAGAKTRSKKMGAASSSEEVAGQLREMGQGTVQRPEPLLYLGILPKHAIPNFEINPSRSRARRPKDVPAHRSKRRQPPRPPELRPRNAHD